MKNVRTLLASLTHLGAGNYVCVISLIRKTDNVLSVEIGIFNAKKVVNSTCHQVDIMLSKLENSIVPEMNVWGIITSPEFGPSEILKNILKQKLSGTGNLEKKLDYNIGNLAANVLLDIPFEQPEIIEMAHLLSFIQDNVNNFKKIEDDDENKGEGAYSWCYQMISIEDNFSSGKTYYS
ncbi:MAG: hypothetical protein NTZ44_02725 [Candidatus Nomurabacteria bacterium]|nr:hypothetical protein [Candidatus Nomurabacteria bacterium]